MFTVDVVFGEGGMHDYSIDNHPKDKIIFLLAFIAIFTAPWIRDLISKLSYIERHHLQWILSGISITSLFTFLYYLFNKHLWKLKWFRKILLIPDLNGEWECNGNTKRKLGQEADVEWNAKVIITQSWSKILIYLSTDESESFSSSASIKRVEGKGFKLLYTYENSPKIIVDDMHRHDGCVELLINLECDLAEGNYFSDNHRSTMGNMKLKRCK